MKQALFRAKDAGCAFQKTLRTAVEAEEGKGRVASKRTDEDDFGVPRTSPELREESAGEEEREVEIEIEHSSCFIF